jgi:gas vesicle protein
MAEAQLDEGLGHLQAFVADLAEKQNDLGTVGERLAELQSSIEALTGNLEATRERVVQISDDRQQQLDGALAEVDGAVGSLVEEGQETGQKLTDVVAVALDEHEGQLSAKTDEHGERLESGAQQLLDEGFGVADQAVETAGGTLQDLRGRTDTSFEEFGAKVEELTTTVQATGEATTSTLADAAEQTNGDLFELVTTGFGSFTEVTDHLLGEDGLVGAFGGFGADLEGGFAQLGNSVTGLGDQLIGQVDGLIASTVEVVEKEVTGRIQEEIEQVIVGSVEGLIADFADSIITMQVGSTITAAVSPWVPELAAAKAVVTTIDDLLESMMLG